MAQKELPDEGPSLEMPSLGSLFKRGRKKPAVAGDGRATGEGAATGGSRRGEQAAGDAGGQGDETPTASDFERLVRGEQPEVVEEAEGGDDVAVGDEAAGAAPDAAVTTPVADEQPVAPAFEPESSVEETTVRGIPAVTEPVADEHPTEVIADLPEHDLIAEEEEASLGDIEEDDPPPAAEQTASAGHRVTAPTAAATPATSAAPTTSAAAAPTTLDEDDLDGDADDDAAPRRTLADFSLPAVPAVAAAGITGAIVGLLAVGLTFFGLQGCEAVKGTSACGGPGIPILVVIMVLLVVIGSALLSAWNVTDPTSTSFLAVGLLAVIALLFLIEVIFSPAMIVVIPLVGVGTYCLSQWVTERFIDEE